MAGILGFARRQVAGAAETVAEMVLLTAEMNWRTAPSASWADTEMEYVILSGERCWHDEHGTWSDETSTS